VVRRLSILLLGVAALASLTGCGSSGAHTTTGGRSGGETTTTGRTTTATIAAAGAFLTPGAHPMLCYAESSEITCGPNHVPRPWRRYAEATLNTSGKLTTCHGLRCIGNYGGAPLPTVTIGRPVAIRRFTCTALNAGVGCYVTGSGHGFVLTGTGPVKSASYSVATGRSRP
jgi:hypothetical protein